MENKKGAKDYSLLAMVVSAVWILTMTVLKGLNIMNLEMSDILASGFSIVGMFVPVFTSIIIDKIKEMKIGKV